MSVVPTVLAGLVFAVGLLLLIGGMTASSSVRGDVVNLDLLASKIISVVAGGCLLIVGMLFEVVAAIRGLMIVDRPAH